MTETQEYFDGLTNDIENTQDCSQNQVERKTNIVVILRKLILKIKRSEKLLQKLHFYQKENNIKKTNPIIDVKTRWNSTYNMLIWAIQNRKVN